MANLRANNLTGTGGRNAITGAVFFGGDNNTGGLTIADTTDLELGSETNWTIEFWIKLNHGALSDWDVIMGKGSDDNGGTEYEWFVEVMAANHLVFLTTTAGEAWDFNQQITPVLAIGEWYHIAIVRNGSGANTLKSYVNGVQYSTHTSQNIYTGNDEFGIGHFGHTNGLNSDVTLSNVRVVKGTSVYTAAFTPPTEKLTIIPNTVLLCCQDSADASQEETGKTITVVGNAKATKDTPSVGVDEGVTFNGDTKVNSQGHMYFPTGDTSQRGRGRGLTGGGFIAPGTPTPTIQSIQIQSEGTGLDFGDLTVARMSLAPMSSATRGLFAGGYTPTNQDVIDYVEIATTGNAVDFGNMAAATKMAMGASNSTRGLMAGGDNINTIQYVTIANTGNTTDFGDLITNSKYGMGCASPTRAIWFLGAYPSNINTIEYTTIATTGNSVDFGDRLFTSSFGGAACSSSTRGVLAGGYNHPTINQSINYVEIATTGNATDFGDLQQAIGQGGSGMSNGSRGVFGGYWGPTTTGAGGQGETNICEYVTIATTGNAKDWGDLYQQTYYCTGVSDSHGGLS